MGNMVTKEFNEAVAIVKHLTQYKPHKYGIAAIKYFNALEWNNKLKDLQEKYGVIAYCSNMQVAILTNEDLLGDINDLKNLIGDKIKFHLSLNYYDTGVKQFAQMIGKSGRSHAYMHISENDNYIGTLILMLYTDIVPLTCENFLRLCTLSRGGYAGTPIHRIVKDGWIQCGGFNLKNTDLPCENYIIRHDKRGVLSMANNGRHCDNSTQFFIITEPAEWMDQKYVAFGQVVDGENTLQKIENSPTRYESPIDKLTIMNAGVLNLYNQGIVPVKGLVNYLNLHIQNPKWIVEDLMKDFQEQLDNIIDLKKMYDQSGESDRSPVKENPKLKQKKRSPNASDSTIDNGSQGTSVPRTELINDSTILSKDSEISVVNEPVNAKLYYYSLVDVPDPLERSSEFDFVKFNLGHLCLETDLESIIKKVKPVKIKKKTTISGVPQIQSDSDILMNSEDEDVLNEFMRDHAQRVSFCGELLSSVAKDKKRVNVQIEIPAYEVEDEEFLEGQENQTKRNTKNQTRSVQIDAPDIIPYHPIKRRPTGFIRMTSDVNVSDDDDSVSYSNSPTQKKVHIADFLRKSPNKIKRRQTGIVRINIDSEEDFALTDMAFQHRPTLVDYKPMNVPTRNNFFLKWPSKRQPSDEERESQLQLEPASKPFAEGIFETFQPEKICTYEDTNIPYIWQTPKQRRISSAEYNYVRPSITMQEYKRRNKTSCLPVWSDLKYIERNIEPKFSSTCVERMSPTCNSIDNDMELTRPNVHLKGDTPTLVSWDSNSSLKNK